MAKVSFDDFLAKARDKHEERYLYDRSSWLSLKDKVKIRCSSHGWFDQVAETHLSSKVGCLRCSKAEVGAKIISNGWRYFVEKSRLKHGDRFAYDRKSWSGTNKKVNIKCPIHGWFGQMPRDHLKFSGGCYECAKSGKGKRVKNKSLIKFEKQADKKFDGKYEYDFSSWNGLSKKVRVKCVSHGWFEQLARDHLRLNGCPDCARQSAGKIRRLAREEIIQKFKKIHGERYCYENMVYETTSQKLTIDCRIHGGFEQSYGEHIRGNGCPKCSGRHRWTTQEFIENSKSVHGPQFTYENTVYQGALAPVTITCKIHGDFTTQPSRHVTRKDGCPRCSPVAHLTQQDFLNRAHARFGDRYDYSKVHFINVATPVQIICKTHGIFEQPPSWHLNNAIGCPQCT